MLQSRFVKTKQIQNETIIVSLYVIDNPYMYRHFYNKVYYMAV